MELNEIKDIWQENNSKLDKLLKLNSHTLYQIQTQKAKSQLSAVYWQRIVEISCHTIALVLLLIFLYFNITQAAYALSALALIVLYVYLFVNCYKQIRLLKTIDASNDIVCMQSSLMRIQSYLLQFHRLALLFVPLFLSYPIVFSKAFSDLNITLFGDFDLIRQTNGVWWTVELIVFAVMTPLGIWYFSQISVKNSHKTWVKRVLNKAASSRINKAIRFLYELKNINEKL